MKIPKAITKPAHCKDCRWWEFLEDEPDVDGHGLCHHPIAFANYLVWWQQHPDLREEVNPPNPDGGFAIEGCHRACEKGETED